MRYNVIISELLSPLSAYYVTFACCSLIPSLYAKLSHPPAAGGNVPLSKQTRAVLIYWSVYFSSNTRQQCENIYLIEIIWNYSLSRYFVSLSTSRTWPHFTKRRHLNVKFSRWLDRNNYIFFGAITLPVGGGGGKTIHCLSQPLLEAL